MNPGTELILVRSKDATAVLYPCPHCGYDCRVQAAEGIDRCPECGGELPIVKDKGNPVILWNLMLRR